MKSRSQIPDIQNVFLFNFYYIFNSFGISFWSHLSPFLGDDRKFILSLIEFFMEGGMERDRKPGKIPTDK